MSNHIYTIDSTLGPDGPWVWRCLTDGCEEALVNGQQVEYIDLGECMTFASAHGMMDQRLGIVDMINAACRPGGVVALNKALAYYADLIPQWENNFPDKVHVLKAHRDALIEQRRVLQPTAF